MLTIERFNNKIRPFGLVAELKTEFLLFLENNIHRLNRKPMHWHEYVCMQALKFAFVDLEQVEAYGFDRYSSLFNHLVKNKVEELYNKENEQTYREEEYADLPIDEALTLLYENILFITKGVNDFNVNLRGVRSE